MTITPATEQLTHLLSRYSRRELAVRLFECSEPEAVLLGSAILGAVAGREYPDVLSAMGAMNAVERVITPQGGAVADYHDRKHRVFHRMYEDQMAYRDLLSS